MISNPIIAGLLLVVMALFAIGGSQLVMERDRERRRP